MYVMLPATGVQELGDVDKSGQVMVFFFKQKTAYEMLRSLVGSEMCIRDRPWMRLSTSIITITLNCCNLRGRNCSISARCMTNLSLIHI